MRTFIGSCRVVRINFVSIPHKFTQKRIVREESNLGCKNNTKIINKVIGMKK